jgi:hypothetical protein
MYGFQTNTLQVVEGVLKKEGLIFPQDLGVILLSIRVEPITEELWH